MPASGRWFWAAFLMATHSNGISALQLENQLGFGACRTARMLCVKQRRAMVNPEREPPSGLVDADETMIPFRTKNDPVVVPGRLQRGWQDAGHGSQIPEAAFFSSGLDSVTYVTAV
jgi:hypothetical protein